MGKVDPVGKVDPMGMGEFDPVQLPFDIEVVLEVTDRGSTQGH